MVNKRKFPLFRHVALYRGSGQTSASEMFARKFYSYTLIFKKLLDLRLQ